MGPRVKRKRPEAKAPERVKINVVLDTEQDTLLGVVAASRRTNKSALIADALRPVLAGYYVSRRGAAGADPVSPPPTAPDCQAA